jgi:hypothetical protein
MYGLNSFIYLFILFLWFRSLTQGLYFEGRCSAIWATPRSFLLLVIFQIEFYIYIQASLDYIPPIYASEVAYDRHTPPGPAFYWWDGVSRTFSPSWPQAVILPISASWVAMIIGVSYLVQFLVYFFMAQNKAYLEKQCILCYSGCSVLLMLTRLSLFRGGVQDFYTLTHVLSTYSLDNWERRVKISKYSCEFVFPFR